VQVIGNQLQLLHQARKVRKIKKYLKNDTNYIFMLYDKYQILL
jgi:hypothetical protein